MRRTEKDSLARAVSRECGAGTSGWRAHNSIWRVGSEVKERNRAAGICREMGGGGDVFRVLVVCCRFKVCETEHIGKLVEMRRLQNSEGIVCMSGPREVKRLESRATGDRPS